VIQKNMNMGRFFSIRGLLSLLGLAIFLCASLPPLLLFYGKEETSSVDEIANAPPTDCNADSLSQDDNTPRKFGLQQPQPTGSKNVVSTPRLFIHVDKFDEGIAGWTTSLRELIIMAKTLNAAFVEPCIENGRLYSCGPVKGLFGHAGRTTGAIVRLGDVFELGDFKEYRIHMISHEIFEMATQKNDTGVELGNGSTQWFRGCHSTKCTEVSSGAMKDIDAINAAVKLVKRNKTASAVINFHGGYRRGRWSGESGLHKGQSLIPKKEMEHFMSQHDFTKFKRDHHDFVDGVLEKAGILNDRFSVIQWRAEVATLDYLTCANHIVRSKNIMSSMGDHSPSKEIVGKSNNEMPFFIITPLHKDKSLAWGKNAHKIDEADEALEVLLDNGFLKFELLMGEQNEAFKVKDKILRLYMI